MRGFLIYFAAASAAMLINTSCTKEQGMEEVVQTSTVKISITGPATKGTGAAFNNQVEDNMVKRLEVFIFNTDGENAGELDSYKRFDNPSTLSGLEMKATVGTKEIYVVANSHKENWNGVVKLDIFKNQVANLTDDNLKDFVMTGYIQKRLDPSATVSLSIERLAAKVVLQSLKTDFANTPYEGMKLSNIKIYLTNVHAKKHFWNGSEASVGVILNSTKLVPADTSSCTMRGMIADVVNGEVGDAGHNISHSFYAFENLAETETSTTRFTRLVIQADLNGKTYYYPVNVNQPYFGYVAGNGHKGIKRNTEYRISVTVKRPGATDPDATILFGTLTATLTIADWVTTAVANPEF